MAVSSAFLAVLIAAFLQPLQYFVPMVALYHDLAVFYRSACSAVGFQFASQFFQISFRTHKPFDQCYCFAGTLPGIKPNTQFLLRRG